MSDETVVMDALGTAAGRRQQLGKYLLEGTLGEGAMGVVYRARDPALDRAVAIKTIRESGFPPEVMHELRTRFEREARSAACLSHPGIVQIYDYGEADGMAYLVMEFVDGRSLKEILTAGERLPVDEAVRVGAAVLDALDHAHSHGVVHRDIKPANVMLTGDGVSKLTDFGIARLEVEGLTVTQAGQIIGTPGYMAPEQVQGHPATKSTDIYATGVMIYELVTGERPFTGSATSLLHRIVHEAPIPPTVINVSAPAWLDAVLLKAMAKRPDERFETAGAFAQALREAGKLHSRRPVRGRLAAASLAAALVVAGAGGTWVYRDALFGTPEPATPIAEEQRPAIPAQEGPSDSAAWDQAQAAATIESFEAYLQAFPEGQYAATARTAIEALQDAAAGDQAWSQAEAADTRSAYEAFLAAYPQHIRAAAARGRIDALLSREAEAQAWADAQAADTAGAYRAFAEAYPQSEWAAAGQQRAAELEQAAREQEQAAAAADAAPIYQDDLAAIPDSEPLAETEGPVAGESAPDIASDTGTIDADDQAWAAAQADGSFAAFEAYTEQFPDGRHRAEAEAAILGFYSQAADARAWQQAVDRDTAYAYRDYLAAFPDGSSADDAASRLQAMERQAAAAQARIAAIEADDQAWAAAQADGSFAAFEAYARQFPDGRHRAEAEAAILDFYNRAAEAGAWQQAIDQDTPDAYRAYLAAFPDGSNATEAQSQIQSLETQSAGTEASGDAVLSGPQVAEASLNLSRDDRRVVQRGLNALGFSAGTVDGILGNNSRGAIRAFQGARGEPATGYLTQSQWRELGDAAVAAVPARVETAAAPAAPEQRTAPPPPIDFGLVARLNGPWADAGSYGCSATLIFSLVNQGGSVRWDGAYGIQSADVTVQAAGDGVVTLGVAGIGPVDVRVTPTEVTFRGRSYRRC